MSAIDLVILGKLKKTPKSAYELAHIVETSKLNKIIKIGSPTIYQNVKKMALKGYLSSDVIKEGEMPEKTIYSLTEAGNDYFIELMGKLSSNPGRIYFNFNSFIKNLGLVDKKTGTAMLKNLKLYFYDLREDLENDINSFASPSFEIKTILNQYHIMLKGMLEWIETAIEDYQNE